MTIVQVRVRKGSDVTIYYDDIAEDQSITRTQAMRLTDGGVFEGDISSSRRMLIHERD